MPEWTEDVISTLGTSAHVCLHGKAGIATNIFRQICWGLFDYNQQSAKVMSKMGVTKSPPDGVLTILAMPPKMGLADCRLTGGSGSVSDPGDVGCCGLCIRR